MPDRRVPAGDEAAQSTTARQGRIGARPHTPTENGATGLLQLGFDRRRDTWIYVPAGYNSRRPTPLVVALHGAGGQGQNHLGHLQQQAEEHNLILLAPSSRQGTWDVLYGEYGPDIAFLDRALEWTFDRYTIDPLHLAIEGFSDGASYALSAGVTNGDVFTHILAFSPGFMAPAAQRGKPEIFISHGTEDNVLPIDVCSRRLVPRLESAGYDVRYVEFTGGHTVPPSIADDAVRWFLEPAAFR